jgi:hypothetical protein
MIENLKIYDVGEKVRLGCLSDGGYVIPKIALKNCDYLFSYGIGDNISFDEDYVLLTNGIAHCYDHTIDYSFFEKNSNIIFYNEGLSGKKTENTNNFLAHYRFLKLTKKVLLKIDVEGAEYEFFENTDLYEFSNIVNCITIEFHNLQDDNVRNLFFKIIKKLNIYFYICHLHGNSDNEFFQLNGFDFPKLLEITFINKKITTLVKIDKNKYPSNLDFPNSNNGQELNHEIFNFINSNIFEKNC